MLNRNKLSTKLLVSLFISLSVFSCSNISNTPSYKVITKENTKNYIIDLGYKTGKNISAHLSYNSFSTKASLSGTAAKTVNDVAKAQVYLLALPSGYTGTDPIGSASFVKGPVDLTSPGGFFTVTFTNVSGQASGIRYFIGVRLQDSSSNNLIKPNNGNSNPWTGVTASNNSFTLSTDSVSVSDVNNSVSSTNPLTIIANLIDATGSKLQTNISSNDGTISSNISAGISDGLSIYAGKSGGSVPTISNQIATNVLLNSPNSVAVDTSGNVYIADTNNNYIEKIDTNGNLRIIAGKAGGSAPSNTIQIATNVQLNNPNSIAVDLSGNVYISDSGNNFIEKIDTSGNLRIIAGRSLGNAPTTNNQVSTSVTLNNPSGVTVDTAGNVYIADTNNNYIEKIDTNGNLKIIAGNSSGSAPSISNQLATNILLNKPRGITIDSTNNLYISDSENNYIEKIDTSGNLKIIAGKSGGSAPTTNNQIATNVLLNKPRGIAVDLANNIFIADTNNKYIEEIDTSGNLKIIAGGGTSAPSNSTIRSLTTVLNNPYGISVDSFGNVYIADTGNNYIEKLFQ